MELIDIIFGVIALALGYGFWVWWKDGKSLRPFLQRVCLWIRSTVGAVSQEEMRMLRQQVKGMEQQWEAKLKKLERSIQMSSPLQSVSKEPDQHLTGFEAQKHLELCVEEAGARPRSIVRFGLRLTVGDALWSHLGVSAIDVVEDRIIETMLQGPFCPICLKRVFVRNRSNYSESMPSHCRHCGVSWDNQGFVDGESSLLDMKRQVYAQLDQEYRTTGKIQPEA